MREGEVEKLRAVVRDCLGKHLYSSAIFFADKLATLAGNATQDLYMQVSRVLVFLVYLHFSFMCCSSFSFAMGEECVAFRLGILGPPFAALIASFPLDISRGNNGDFHVPKRGCICSE